VGTKQENIEMEGVREGENQDEKKKKKNVTSGKEESEL
jgi:hypothetical protein